MKIKKTSRRKEKLKKRLVPLTILGLVALGIIYHGHGPKLWKKQHSLHQALFNGSDKEFIDAVTKFYSGNSRSSRHKNFWK